MSLWRWLATRFAHVGHGSGWHRGATQEDGTTPKLCDTCLKPVGTILSGEMIADGPAQVAAVVHGRPTGKAQREKRNNVAPWKAINR